MTSRTKTDLIALNFTSDIERLARDFTGRKWLLDEVDAWLKRERERFFILTGEPGVGKSAFAAWLIHTRKDIASHNFCIADRNDTIVPNTVLRSLGAQLSHSLPDYGKALANTIKPEKVSVDVKISVESMTGGEITGVIINHLHASDPKEVLDIILRAPLAALPRSTEPIIILIDSLDEAVTYRKDINLVTLLSGLNDLPPWVRIFCTSRPERNALCYFDGLSPHIFAAESKMNLEDVEKYIINRVGRKSLQARIKSAGKNPEDLITKLKDKDLHSGNFLYTKVLLDDIEAGRQSLEDLSALPKSIDEIYHGFLRRFKAPWEKRYQPILGTLAVVREPVSETQLSHFTRIKRTQMRQSLGEIIQFLDEHGDGGKGEPYTLYHQSFRDYLLDEKRNVDFWCASEDGHQGIADYYLKKCGKQWSTCDDYGLRHLPEHLTGAGEAEILQGLLINFDWLQAKLERTEPNALIRDYYFLPNDQDLCLIQGAIRLSANILIADKAQLAAQLLGRLMTQSDSRIQKLLKGLLLEQERRGKLWLRPLKPSMIPSGGSMYLTLKGHTGRVDAVVVTPDGRHAISTSNEDKTIKVWDLPSGMVLRTFKGYPGCVRSVTPDGLWVIFASGDNTIKIWDLEGRFELRSLKGHTGWVTAVAVTPDGRCAVSASEDWTLKVWDLPSGTELRTLSGHTGPVDAVAMTPDGCCAVSASFDWTLKVWDLPSGTELRTLKGHTGWVKAVAVTPDGRHAISASVDGTLKVWDLVNWTELSTLKGHSGPVQALAVTQDGRYVISASSDNTLKVWDLARRAVLCTLEDYTWVEAVAVTPDGQYAISASEDSTLKVWDLSCRVESNRLIGHRDHVTAVVATPDGRHAISASIDSTLKIWDLQSGTELRTLRGHTGWVNEVAVTPDGRYAISALSDSALEVWDLSNGTSLRTLNGNTLAVTPDGRHVISNFYSTLKVWDLVSGEELHSLEGHKYTITAVAVTPDGRYAISASEDWTIKIWDLMSGADVHTLTGHAGLIRALAVTPDGRYVISASTDSTLKMWDVASGMELRTLEGGYWLGALAVTPDGRFLLSPSEADLKVWDLLSGTESLTLKGAGQVGAVTPNGRHVISIRGDLKIWDLTNGDLITNFSADESLSCCAVNSDNATIIAGDSSGRIHFLRLQGKAKKDNDT